MTGVVPPVEVILLVVPETLVTPVPAGVAQDPSPRQKVVAPADVPLFRFVTGRFPVTPFARFTCAQAGLFEVPVFEMYLVALASFARDEYVFTPVPIIRSPWAADVSPVPPYCTPIAVPFQTPVVIVPNVVIED
jgi:hypothetical protein